MPLQITLVGDSSATNTVANPRDMVTIKEGTPYTVPTSKIFVLTGLGTVLVSTATVIPVTLLLNGVAELRAGIFGAGQTTVQAGTNWSSGVASCAEIPIGVSYPAGAVLTVDDGVGGQSNGRAYGYLAAA